MKVLFLTHSYPRRSGDAPGSFILRLARALADEGAHVHVLAPAGSGAASREVLDGIPVQRFRYAPSRFETLAYTGSMAQDVATSWSARLALVGYMGADMMLTVASRRDLRPDIVHAHWWFPSGVVARVAARPSRTPLVTTLHGTDVRVARKVAASRPLFRSVLAASACVTTVSSWLAREVAEMAPGVVPEIAPMPVATERFTPRGSRERARLLFAGRLNRQKGLDHLLRALAAMKQLAMLDVVGEGAEEQSLKRLASELGVSDRVVWHGQLDQDGLVRMYQSATALVVPSTDEGLGLVAAEALLCETPVVAFRSGGLTDIVKHGATGILVNPGDTAELGHALDSLLSSPEHARDLGRAGRSFAAAAFSPETAGRRYADIYRKALERPAS